MTKPIWRQICFQVKGDEGLIQWDDPFSWRSSNRACSSDKTCRWKITAAEIKGFNYSKALCHMEDDRVCDGPLEERTGGWTVWWKIRALRGHTRRKHTTPTAEHKIEVCAPKSQAYDFHFKIPLKCYSSPVMIKSVMVVSSWSTDREKTSGK